MSQQSAAPILQIDHLTMRFGGLVAIDDVSFAVERRKITALIGPNGAGKTTVFNCITGFYKPTTGLIALYKNGDRPMARLSAHDIAERARGKRSFREGGNEVFLLERMADHEITAYAGVARTFQNIRLFSGMTVLENLVVAQHRALAAASMFAIGGLLGTSRYRKAEAEAIDFACYWLENLHLIDRADDAAGDLPYGDQRRLEIARAMCTRPRLLCLDEPAAGLNNRESAELNDTLRWIRDEHDMSILLIEHDMGVVMGISDHIVVLDYGKKISDGTPEFVRNDPHVIAAYLGVPDEDVARVEQEVQL
jgi:branched-chain amino acid transport system ATP-binding protein